MADDCPKCEDGLPPVDGDLCRSDVAADVLLRPAAVVRDHRCGAFQEDGRVHERRIRCSARDSGERNRHGRERDQAGMESDGRRTVGDHRDPPGDQRGAARASQDAGRRGRSSSNSEPEHRGSSRAAGDRRARRPSRPPSEHCRTNCAEQLAELQEALDRGDQTGPGDAGTVERAASSSGSRRRGRSIRAVRVSIPDSTK